MTLQATTWTFPFFGEVFNILYTYLTYIYIFFHNKSNFNLFKKLKVLIKVIILERFNRDLNSYTKIKKGYLYLLNVVIIIHTGWRYTTILYVVCTEYKYNLFCFFFKYNAKWKFLIYFCWINFFNRTTHRAQFTTFLMVRIYRYT